ncbi:pyridoxamine 5'-phosphate oxidase family protein [Actinoplanes sp. NPDC051343]|uniref:pyridoxamine 5'-phosphate oxidase family protein n=1 Tax=Actinoplanes sp. NPDC051343 TaxID=3363906 RepID=UPI0037B347DE
MRWSSLEEQQPRLASMGRQRLIGPGVVLVVTIRRDGTPRLSPVEPFLLDGELWLSMMPTSWKAADLDRDPRVLVHSVITSRDGAEGEFKVRGVVRDQPDPEVQRRYAEAVAGALGWSPEPGRFRLFAVDVLGISVIRYDSSTGDQFVTRWPTGGEFVRRGTSATTLGPPSPAADLLVVPGH